MQYDQLNKIFPTAIELYEASLRAGLSVEEYAKEYLAKLENIQQWNVAHVESCYVCAIEKVENEHGYQLIVISDKNGVKKKNYSKFFPKDNCIYDLWKYCIDKECLMYIGYNKNTEDGSAYRVVLDLVKR